MITIVHLVNNYTGSSRVVQSIAEKLKKNTIRYQVITSTNEGLIESPSYTTINQKGALSLIGKVRLYYRTIKYINKYGSDKILFTNVTALVLLPFITKRSNKEVYVYVQEVIENYNKFIQCCLRFIIHFYKFEYFFAVSDYARMQLSTDKSATVYNSLDEKLFTSLIETKNSGSYITFISSFKIYKGYETFIHLAEINPDLSFQLILTGNEQHVNVPDNTKVSWNIRDMSQVYSSSSVVLNLSSRHAWIETFGMTLLEAMIVGCPVIGPNAGGPKEILMQDSRFLVDEHNVKEINEKLYAILSNYNECSVLMKSYSNRILERAKSQREEFIRILS